MPRHLHIDPINGLSGDMFLGMLFDLGCPTEVVADALRPLQTTQPWRLSVHRVLRHGISACQVKVLVGGDQLAGHSHDDDHAPHAKHGHHGHHDHHGHGHNHPSTPQHGAADAHDHAHAHTSAADILKMIEQLTGPERIRRRARRIVTHLAEAEAKIHGTTPDQIHFHEVGAVDSIVDMLGATVALEHLGVDTLSCGSLPLGCGFVACQHGLMPLPAPATALLLTGIPSYGVERVGETVTPTGAALVKALCRVFGNQPEMTVEKVGIGAGERHDPAVPNIARGFMGTRIVKEEAAHPADWRATMDELSPAAKLELQRMIEELTGTKQLG